MTADQVWQFFLSGLTTGGTYALIALGFSLIYNATGVINFAQGEFVMLGGMIAAASMAAWDLPLWLAALIAIAITTVVGLVLDRAAIRPARYAPHVVLIIITIGASIFIRGTASIIWGPDERPVQAFSGEAPIVMLGAAITPQSLWVLGATLVSAVAMWLIFEYTVVGKAMRACAINAHAAQLCGIELSRMVSWSFGLAAAIGAVAGIVLAPITMAQYNIGTMLGLKGFVAAIIGGMGNSLGAIVGGLVLGVLEALGAGLISSQYKDAIAFIILIIVLLVRPSGILGREGGED
ncbi:MAG: branched-chain amino acid ABC transporter permease [candidate division WS1 bacterium]|jgi:branched-chain amino acid transport system permease protein|nr:branched-chain amino acid ABC transporter permease [candidate division WS1 bacterium]